MKNILRIGTSVLLAALLPAMSTVFVVGDALAASLQNEKAMVKPGPITGSITETSGKDLGPVKITVFNAGGVEVASTDINEKGGFTLPSLEAGSYTLKVNDGVPLPFEVSEKAELASLELVVPDSSGYAAGQDGSWLAANWIWVAGVALLVAVPVTLALTLMGPAPCHESPQPDRRYVVVEGPRSPTSIKARPRTPGLRGHRRRRHAGPHAGPGPHPPPAPGGTRGRARRPPRAVLRRLQRGGGQLRREAR